MKKPATPSSFEQALAELEAVVTALEQGEMTLEDSLTAFERGINLSRVCQQTLAAAEQRVRILTDPRPGAEPEPFEPHDSD